MAIGVPKNQDKGIKAAPHPGDLGVGQQGGKGFGRWRVGEQPVDLRQRGHLDHGGAVELADVGGQPDLARMRNDGLRHLDLAVVVVAQRAVGLDARNADQRNVHLELADEVDRCLAHDALVAPAHHATDHDHLALGIGAEDAGHVQVVGDDAQAACGAAGRVRSPRWWCRC